MFGSPRFFRHRRTIVLALLAASLGLWSAFSWPQPLETENVAVTHDDLATKTLLWFDSSGKLNDQASQAAELLANAGTDGLDPRDYNASQLQRAVGELKAEIGTDPQVIARLDDSLTAAMQQYLKDLHQGRVDPRQIHANFNVARNDVFNAAEVLRSAIMANRLPQAVREAAPQLPLYANLRQSLAQYLALAAHPAWASKLPALPGTSLKPTVSYSGLQQLVERLEALGDLPPNTPVPSAYEGAVVAAVKAFQQRHGIASDGVIGKITLAALEVTPAARARQIALTLERVRWTPLLQGSRMIVVNVPEFVLRAYETHGDRINVKLEMKVIVGKALDTRTPLFDEQMRFIEFSPYWNVPASIAREEIVPRLRRDPAYFHQQGFEIVGQDGKVSSTLGAEALNAVLRGELRLRQRPGASNALGDIKFVFPNNEAIYLHHTPSPQLFKRDRRDLSHGCIRVEEPVALAKFVLQNQPEWTEARIREAMGRGTSHTIQLQQQIPVLIAYSTALIKGGRIHFFQDVYGHDRQLDEALRQRSVRLAEGLSKLPSR